MGCTSSAPVQHYNTEAAERRAYEGKLNINAAADSKVAGHRMTSSLPSSITTVKANPRQTTHMQPMARREAPSSTLTERCEEAIPENGENVQKLRLEGSAPMDRASDGAPGKGSGEAVVVVPTSPSATISNLPTGGTINSAEHGHCEYRSQRTLPPGGIRYYSVEHGQCKDLAHRYQQPPGGIRYYSTQEPSRQPPPTPGGIRYYTAEQGRRCEDVSPPGGIRYYSVAEHGHCAAQFFRRQRPVRAMPSLKECDEDQVEEGGEERGAATEKTEQVRPVVSDGC